MHLSGNLSPALLSGMRGILLTVAVFLYSDIPAGAEEEKPPLQPQPIQVLFFVPSDLAVPDGVTERLTKIADAAEAFFFNGMTRQGYPPATKSLFHRLSDGHVKVLHIRSSDPVSSGKYANPTYAGDIVRKAIDEYHVPGQGTVWWIFIYLGDRPTRFENWAGAGNPREGGWAMINYDTVPGEIRPDLQLTEGFNFEYKLKSTIHELAHGLGLPHMGPDPTLNLGNSLMGPNPPMYATRPSFTKGDHVYLAASEAAMLWKHPLFRGEAMGNVEAPKVQLEDYRASCDPDARTITVSGRLVTSQPVHSVVLIDNRGDPNEYWSRSYVTRLAADGTFQIKVNDPAKVDGIYRILFCFESGIVSGDGTHIGPNNRGEIRKPYRFYEGQMHFQD